MNVGLATVLLLHAASLLSEQRFSRVYVNNGRLNNKVRLGAVNLMVQPRVLTSASIGLLYVGTISCKSSNNFYSIPYSVKHDSP